MRLRIKGIKFKYGLTFYKHFDENKIKYPKYSITRKTSIFKFEKWINCSFYFFKKKKKLFVEIGAIQRDNNGQSELGFVDEHGKYKTLEVSLFAKTQILTYDKIYIFKIQLFKFFDKIRPIKKNLLLIFLALFVASIYYLINYYFNNYLQNLINRSNFVQSIIVFLSISSIINIFHPFTFRKEINIKDVNELIDVKAEKAIEDAEHEEWRKNNFL